MRLSGLCSGCDSIITCVDPFQTLMNALRVFIHVIVILVLVLTQEEVIDASVTMDISKHWTKRESQTIRSVMVRAEI